MRCIKCGLRFTSEEVTAEDAYGRDLCPACCAPISPKEEGLAIHIANEINCIFDYKAFAEQMSREHRTLQSDFTTLCLEWLRKCREMYEADNYDGRNEHSCCTGKVLMDYLEKGKF